MIEKLREYQKPHAQHLLDCVRRNQTTLDLSDCGLGKTFSACYVLKQLNQPTLVVCPKIIQTQWRRTAEVFNDEHAIVGYEKLRAGNTPFGRWERDLPPRTEREYLVCQVCQCKVEKQACPYHPAGIHCVAIKTKPFNRGKFLFAPEIEVIVFDEVDRCNGSDSQNMKMLIAAKDQGKRILGLSATVATTPMHFRGLGYALGLHNLKDDLLERDKHGLRHLRIARPSFKRWVSKYHVRYDPNFHGFHWFVGEDRQQDIMRAIRETIIPRFGGRLSVAELPDFPQVDIQAELYDLEEAEKVNAIYDQMAAALAVVEGKSSVNRLTEILREREKIELLKVPVAVELAEDYTAQGISIGIFVNFRSTMEELRKRLDTDCFVDGSPEGVKGRERSVDRFQCNDSKLILVNTDAGGVGLTLSDLHGGHPRGGLVFPGLRASGLKQAFGRFPRDGAKSKSFYRVILAAGTYETSMHRNLRGKLNNLDALLDADLQPDNLRLTSAPQHRTIV